MILSNWMTLNSYNPKECYEWFLSQFVDAYEWVMVPNVYGMGLFADGGFLPLNHIFLEVLISKKCQIIKIIGG